MFGEQTTVGLCKRKAMNNDELADSHFYFPDYWG